MKLQIRIFALYSSYHNEQRNKESQGNIKAGVGGRKRAQTSKQWPELLLASDSVCSLDQTCEDPVPQFSM